MRLVESEVMSLHIHGNQAVISPLVRHGKTYQEGLVPSVCLKPYSKEVASELIASDGLGTTSTQLLSSLVSTAQLSSVAEEEVEEEKEAEVVEEEGGVGAEDGIVMEGCYMAVAQDFKARRPDEMDVKEGDVVCVLDDSQAGDDEGDGVVWEHIYNTCWYISTQIRGMCAWVRRRGGYQCPYLYPSMKNWKLQVMICCCVTYATCWCASNG